VCRSLYVFVISKHFSTVYESLGFILLLVVSIACSTNAKLENTSGQTPSELVKKEYSDSVQKSVLTDSVATEIPQQF